MGTGPAKRASFGECPFRKLVFTGPLPGWNHGIMCAMNYSSPEFISDRRADGLREAMRGILVVCFAVAVGRAAYPYAAAGERRVGENAPYQAVEAAWIDEGIATAGDTGEWSGEVLYERETGRATLDGEYVFTPNTPSTGNYVTLKVAMSFTRDKGDTVPDADAQGAVRLGRNGFQVWTGSWLDVAAAVPTQVFDPAGIRMRSATKEFQSKQI